VAGTKAHQVAEGIINRRSTNSLAFVDSKYRLVIMAREAHTADQRLLLAVGEGLIRVRRAAGGDAEQETDKEKGRREEGESLICVLSNIDPARSRSKCSTSRPKRGSTRNQWSPRVVTRDGRESRGLGLYADPVQVLVSCSGFD